MQSWEYLMLQPEIGQGETDLDEWLNETGDGGWELVCVVGSSPKLQGLWFVFKRPKSQTP